MADVAVLLGVCMLLHYAAALMLFGIVLARAMLRSAGEAAMAAIDGRLRRLVCGAALLALLTAVAFVPLQTRSMAGDWPSVLDPDAVATVLFGTAFGKAWDAHLIFAIAAAALAFGSSGRWLLAAAALLLVSLAMVGHAAMDEGLLGVAHRLNHAVHLLAAGTWLGGLAPLALITAKRRGADPGSGSHAAILRRFSGYATLAVVLVLASGVVNTLIIAGNVRRLFATPYGEVLLAKLTLVAVMVALATANRYLLLPRFADESRAAARRISLSILAEIVLGAAVVLAAVILGMTAPPGTPA